MKIGYCIFVKINVLGQNSEWGRFSRFCASCWSFFVFKFTNAKLTLRLTCSSNFRLIPATVCLQELLERLWLCFHWTLWRKVRWPLCIWIGALKIHSNRWYRQSKYDRKLKFCNLVVLAMIFSATNLEIKRNWKLAQNLKKRPHAQFWPKTSIFTKTQYPIFLALSNIGILTSFTHI